MCLRERCERPLPDEEAENDIPVEPLKSIFFLLKLNQAEAKDLFPADQEEKRA